MYHSYDIHKILSVVSEAPLPELEAFSTSELIADPDIRVRIGKPSRKPAAVNTNGSSRSNGHGPKKVRHLYYREMFGKLGFEAEINIGERIEIVASPLLRYSPHVLYTNLVEPVLRWTFVERGYALVHGATIAFGDRAYMITARTDTGKTTTLLKILDHQRRNTDSAAFISDDLTLVKPDGTALTYPKPLTISHHTVQAINSAALTSRERLTLMYQSRIHSRSGRRLAFNMTKARALPMATINTIVQLLVPPPKYHVNRLVPKVKMAHHGTLTGLFIIEKGVEADTHLDEQEAIDILLANCEDAYGFPPYHDIKEFLYISNGVDLRPVEKSIIRSAMHNIPATLIRSNSLEWWRRIPAFVGDEVAAHFQSSFDRASQALQTNTINI
jgi:hypothetical protein